MNGVGVLSQKRTAVPKRVAIWVRLLNLAFVGDLDREALDVQ